MPFFGLNFTNNRLRTNNHLHPLYPLSTTPLDKAETKVIYDLQSTKPVKTQAANQANYSTLSPKRAELYKFFQKNIDEPVYLKRGAPDKALFLVTVAGTIVGLIWSFKIVYDLAQKK